MIHLHADIASPPGSVECDPEALERVVHNLMDNALKFTSPGGHVHVTLLPRTASPGRITFVVQDNGLGIPPASLDRVSERYFRVGNHPTGSGLGLSISKEIVALHAGTFAISSPPPGAAKGTAVRVCLPEAVAPVALTGCADARIAATLAEQLTASGYQVVTAPGIAQALFGADTARADVVVLALGPSPAAEADALARLRDTPPDQRKPIVVIDASADDAAVPEMLRDLALPVLPSLWPETDLLDLLEAATLRAKIFQTG